MLKGDAAGIVARRHGAQAQVRLPAGFLDLRAARGKGAAGRQGRQVGHLARYRVNALRLPANARDAAQQSLGIGVLRIVDDLIHGAALDDPAGIHDGDAVAELGSKRQVVGDQDDAGAVVAVDAPHDVHNLGLNGDVQRRGRLVGEDQGRLANETDGNQRALLHAAGELVRVITVARFRRRDADFAHHLQHPLFLPVGAPVNATPPRQETVQPQGLADLLADRENGIERALRVLKDHRDFPAAQRPHLAGRQVVQAPAFIANLALGNPAGAGNQVENREQDGALATAGLADDAQDFAGIHAQVDGVDGGHDAAPGGEDRGQLA